MASSAPSRFETEVQQHLNTFKQYKGKLQSGGSLRSMTPEQIQQTTGCSQEEAQAIHALWPVYQLGQQDSQGGSSSSGSSSSR